MLLDKIRKILKLVLTKKVNKLIKFYNIFSKTYFSSCYKISTKYVIYYLLKEYI